jgi:hypothetical protein
MYAAQSLLLNRSANLHPDNSDCSLTPQIYCAMVNEAVLSASEFPPT